MDDISSRWTPINDADSSCDRTSATLCIYDIDHDLVTQQLGIKPTRGSRLGKPTSMPSGKVKIGRVNSWLLSTEENVSSKDLRTHLNWLLEKLEPVAEQIHELQQIPGTKMSVRCSWWSAEGGGEGPTLWPEQMGGLAKLNLEWQISVLYYDDDK